VSAHETDAASAVPQTLDLRRHLELEGRRRQVNARRLLLAALALIPLLALLGIFGQRPATSVADGDSATLKVYSPHRVPGGLLFTTRFEIDAKQELRHPRLILDPGWIEGMQVNSITPGPVAQRSEEGRIVFELDRIPAGRKSVTFIEFQVDPTNVGHRSQNVTLADGDRRLLEIHRAVTVFP
jgi:hypothetical protein